MYHATPFTPAPRPLNDWPSPYFAERTAHLREAAVGATAADIGAGYGRHARLLAELGYRVFAIDLDFTALKSVAADSRLSIQPVVADVRKGLPVRPCSLALAIAVHVNLGRTLRAVIEALKPGGLFLYETPANHGMNWHDLPRAGQVQAAVKRDCDLIDYRERPAGPAKECRSVVRLLARKRAA